MYQRIKATHCRQVFIVVVVVGSLLLDRAHLPPPSGGRQDVQHSSEWHRSMPCDGNRCERVPVRCRAWFAQSKSKSSGKQAPIDRDSPTFPSEVGVAILRYACLCSIIPYSASYAPPSNAHELLTLRRSIITDQEPTKHMRPPRPTLRSDPALQRNDRRRHRALEHQYVLIHFRLCHA